MVGLDLHAFRKILFLLSLSQYQKIQKSHLDLSSCLFFAEEECFSDWSRQDLTATITQTNDERQTRLQINIIQDTKPEGLLLNDDDDLVFWIMMNKTSTNVTY